MTQKQLRLFAFDVLSPAHLTSGSWRDPSDEGHRYTELSYWTETAQLLESAGFDGIFFADTLGYHDVYEGRADAAIRDAGQFPINDPALLISGMAAVTNHLTFGVTSSLTYEQPYMMARRFSTLDHLTNGRVGWNIVTSYSESAAQNLGLVQQLDHDERYDRAEEYMEVLYKLWEESWSDGAVVRDRNNATYADPGRIRPIDHSGQFFAVPGFHLCEPSPQRTPVLFQAGASSRGMAFAGRHAEVVFINAVSVGQARRNVEKIRQAAVENGRDPYDIKVVVLLTVVTGASDEEAAAKYQRARANVSVEGALARFAGWTGLDLSGVDMDKPLQHVKTRGVQSIVDMFSKMDPDQVWTPRKVAEFLGVGGTGSTIVGSPTTVADEIARWQNEADIDGINLSYATKPAGWKDFIQHVLPELRRRGLVPEAPGAADAPLTLRERLYGDGIKFTLPAHPATIQREGVPAEATPLSA